jgi:hypothetical protein
MVGFLVKDTHFRERPVVSGYQKIALSPIETAQRDWREIFLKGKKVGYAVNLIKPFEQGYLIQEEVFLRLNLMGMGSGVYTITQTRVDGQFLLKSFEFGMTSGVVNYRVLGIVRNGTLVITTGRGKEKRTRQIKLERPPMIGAGMGYYFRNRKLALGETFRIPLFDPSTMSQREVLIKVVSRESVTVNRISYDAFRLEGEFWGRKMTFWLDRFGTIIREEGFMGLTAVKSSAARAPRNLEAGEELDFYEMTSVKVSKRLPQPERLRYLKLGIEGIDPGAPYVRNLNEGRQRYRDGILEVRREKNYVRDTFQLPYGDPEGKMKAFLHHELNIESDSRVIIDRAREILGDEKKAVFAAPKLMDWVYENIEKKPVVSVPSALEVLRTRVGDCNEHATLLTALLRAAGIPARLCIGLVYTRDKFFYHAWTEAYVGKWVTMDATTNQMPADVTHIKLIEGNLDRQVEIAGLIGRLKLEVLDYE